MTSRKYLTGVRARLTEQLEQHSTQDLRVASKLGWLRHQFNLAASAENVPAIPLPLQIEATPSLDGSGEADD